MTERTMASDPAPTRTPLLVGSSATIVALLSMALAMPAGGAVSTDARPAPSETASMREMAVAMVAAAAADNVAVETRDGGLADIAQELMRPAEIAHPFPVIARGVDIMGLLLFEIGPGAERSLSRTGQDHDRDPIVPGNILESCLQFAQRREINAVEHFGAIEGHRGAAASLLINDILEVE